MVKSGWKMMKNCEKHVMSRLSGPFQEVGKVVMRTGEERSLGLSVEEIRRGQDSSQQEMRPVLGLLSDLLRAVWGRI